MLQDHCFSPPFSPSPHKCRAGMDKVVLTPSNRDDMKPKVMTSTKPVWGHCQCSQNKLCWAALQLVLISGTTGAGCKEGPSERLEVKFSSLCKEGLHPSTASVKGACSGLSGCSPLQIHKSMLAVEGVHSWHQRQGKNKTRKSLTKALQFLSFFIVHSVISIFRKPLFLPGGATP